MIELYGTYYEYTGMIIIQSLSIAGKYKIGHEYR